MRVSPAAVAVPFLLLLLTWLLLSGLNLNSPLFDRQLRALDDFAMIENALHRDVLTARAGLLRPLRLAGKRDGRAPRCT